MTNKEDLTVFGTPEAAAKLNIQESSLRRLLIKLNAQGEPVGRKLTERAWVLTPAEIEKLGKREDKRGKWQQEGGRQRYLEKVGKAKKQRPRL